MELHRYQTQIKLYKIDYYQINGGLVSMVCNKNGKRQDLTPFSLDTSSVRLMSIKYCDPRTPRTQLEVSV